MKQLTLAAAGFDRYAKTTRRAVFLAEMERVVPWSALCALIEPFYPKPGNGRPPIGVERMQPRSVVKAATPDVAGGLRVGANWGDANPRAAFRADPTVHHVSAFGGALDCHWLPLKEPNCIGRQHYCHCKGAAAHMLAVMTVAGIDDRGSLGDLVSHSATLATASLRKLHQTPSPVSWASSNGLRRPLVLIAITVNRMRASLRTSSKCGRGSGCRQRGQQGIAGRRARRVGGTSRPRD
jgi:hypothetical protein